MPTPHVIVKKFGGTSVATAERRQHAVRHVRRAREEGYAVATVVSAMGRRGDPYATDTLLDLLRADGSVAPADYTLMFVTGEIISAAMMSHTLNRAGIPACALTGAQARIFTDGHPTEAEILEIDVKRLERLLAQGTVPVITGGQGIVRETFDYNTLGRGASDTSGVAVGVALGAETAEIYTDVEGVFTADPRIVPSARILARVSFARMHALARFGAKVVHPRAVKTGWDGGTPVVVRSTFSDAPGTWIGDVHDESPFSGIASLGPLHTASVAAGALDGPTLDAWEQRRLIMNVTDDRTGALLLGAPDARELDAALGEAGVSPLERHGEKAWVTVVGESARLNAGAPIDLEALARAGAPCLLSAGEDLRRTYVVDPAVSARAVRALHDRHAA